MLKSKIIFTTVETFNLNCFKVSINCLLFDTNSNDKLGAHFAEDKYTLQYSIDSIQQIMSQINLTVIHIKIFYNYYLNILLSLF